MINFHDNNLVKKFGSWVKVQVAFYDYLFKTAVKMCASYFNSHSQFADGEDFYEESVKNIEKTFKTQEDAWNGFVEIVKENKYNDFMEMNDG